MGVLAGLEHLRPGLVRNFGAEQLTIGAPTRRLVGAYDPGRWDVHGPSARAAQDLAGDRGDRRRDLSWEAEDTVINPATLRRSLLDQHNDGVARSHVRGPGTEIKVTVTLSRKTQPHPSYT